jgi:hypothetical protein
MSNGKRLWTMKKCVLYLPKEIERQPPRGCFSEVLEWIKMSLAGRSHVSFISEEKSVEYGNAAGTQSVSRAQLC